MEDKGVYDLIVEVLNDLVNGEKTRSNGEKEGIEKTVMAVLAGVKVEGMKYGYNQGDQLILKENLITGDYYEYAYDARGNLTGDGVREYEYDALDRLVKITDEKGRATRYTYDSLGRRTAVDFNGEVTRYHYLGESDKVVKEVRPDGEELSFTYDNEGSPLTMVYNGQTYYYVFNGHGDVVALTDSKGNKVASYRYDPWGRVLKAHNDEDETIEGQARDNEDETVEGQAHDDQIEDDQLEDENRDDEIGELNPYLYAGYRYDKKTKLYFLKTRYYDPLMGRYLSRDKYVPKETEDSEGTALLPVGQNKYVYVNNNPVNMVDPNGQWGFSIKSITRSISNTISRAASTVKNITRSISPKATVNKIVQSGSKIAANIKSNVTKVTAKAQQKIQKATKTVKNLVNPKTIKQKTRAIANGVKATTNSIKKTVSGAVSKAEKFMGAPKLALVQAAKNAKGAMVKYAMPNINRAVSAISKNPIGKAVVNQVKFQAGMTLGLFDAAKSTAKGFYKTGKYLLTTDPRQIGQDVRTAAGNIKQGFKNAINNPKQTMAAIKSGAISAGRAFANADSMERGRIVGRIGGEIGLAFAGTKGIDKLSKVAKGSQLLSRMGNAAKLTRATVTATSGMKNLQINLQLFAAKGPGKVVIGESMKKRVIPLAEKIGATYYKPKSTNPANWMKNNERWIRKQMREGKEIIDIGIDPNRAVRSEFYEMEKRVLEEAGYPVTRP